MKKNGLVVIGASLGGLEALGAILCKLPEEFPAPVVVVQHRAADDGSRLAEVLDRRSSLPVVEPDDRQVMEPGHVYLGPADYHLLVDEGAFYFSTDGPEHYARPSIDVLFESAADSTFKPLVGVLLTAASEDGARGLLKIAQTGGTTIAQDPTEALSPIAIQKAIQLEAVQKTLRLRQIAPVLVQLLTGR